MVALLHTTSMPIIYWGEAALMVVYLIDRLPTLVLQGLSPYQKLFNAAPDYKFLWIFGCACFLWLHPYVNDKLQPRSKCCVFIGYASNFKGYRCLDRSTGRVYISRHTLFRESVFPFEHNKSQVVNCPSKLPLSLDPIQSSKQRIRLLLFLQKWTRYS